MVPRRGGATPIDDGSGPAIGSGSGAESSAGAGPSRSRLKQGRGSSGFGVESSSDKAENDSGASKMSSVPPRPPKLRPPEILSEALAQANKEPGLDGRAITLADVLKRTPDREQQIRVTQAYWKLAAAQAEYHFARDLRDRLGTLVEAEADQEQRHPQHQNSKEPIPVHSYAPAHSARAMARGLVEDAKLDVLKGQQELGEQMSLLGNEPLPLAIDRPHVGGYTTYFDEKFRNTAAPPRLRLIHRALPLRRKVIDEHAAAVVAALDAVQSTGEDFRLSKADLTTLLTVLDELGHERRAFVTAVRDYNQDIAEYAFTVAPPGLNEEALVKLLIKTGNKEQRGDAGHSESRTEQPAGRTFGESSPAIDEDEAARERDLRPGEDSGASLNSVIQWLVSRTARKPIPAAAGGLYQNIASAAPSLRTKKVAELLHWDRSLPADPSQQVTLGDYLERIGGGDRRVAITAYWHARERVAVYQALADRVDQLQALSELTVRLHDQAGGPAAMLRLQAARLVARAAVLDAHILLLGSQYELTRLVGASLDSPWLLPSTPPHAGRYRLQAEHPDASKASRRLQYVSSVLPLLHQNLLDQTEAIVSTDGLRAQSISQAESLEHAASHPVGSGAHTAGQRSPIDMALWTIARQSRETLGFLNTLTSYNLAIADYALATTAPGMPAQKFIATLIVQHKS